MSGEEVKLLQQRLTDADCFQGAIDGTATKALEDAKKACPDQDPILRIETGMHVAPISRISADAECRIAAPGHGMIAGVIGEGFPCANGGGNRRSQRHGAGFRKRAALADRYHTAAPACPGHAPARRFGRHDLGVADHRRRPARARDSASSARRSRGSRRPRVNRHHDLTPPSL